MNVIVKNEQEGIMEMFWTDATKEDIAWCASVNKDRYDMIMKWDRDTIKTNVGWIRYHLNRTGFKITNRSIENDEFIIDVPVMDII